jgi:hypothetical protein
VSYVFGKTRALSANSLHKVLPMQLSSMRYLDATADLPMEKLPGSEPMAWTEVTKGLVAILAGYVLSVLNVVAAGVMLWYTTGGFQTPVAQVTGDNFSILLIGSAVLFFSSLYSSYLVIRGKWRCMMNAPERRGAKWLAFASLVCIFAGPAINFASSFVGMTAPRPRPRPSRVEELPRGSNALTRYAEELRGRNLTAYLRLAGSTITPLGPIFFVLFLRAIHRCLGGFLGARFTEMYLLFVVLLFAGGLSLLLDSQVRIQVDLLAALALGWLVATIWYFLLIIGAVFGISAYLNEPRSLPGA